MEGTPQKTKKNTRVLLLGALEHYLAISSRVAFVTLGIFALFSVPAYYLDMYFGTSPVIFIIALLISLPCSVYSVYRVMQSFVTHQLKS